MAGKKRPPLGSGRNGNETAHADRKAWWLDEKDSAMRMRTYFDALKSAQSARRDRFLRAARLYGNLNLLSLDASGYSRLDGNRDAAMTMNGIQAVVDAIAAKIAKDRPKPTFLTEGGSYSKMRAAKKLGKFSNGLFESGRIRELAPQSFIDAGVFGKGGLQVCEDPDRPGEILVERVYMDEIYVDDLEAYYGKPRTFFRVRACSRETLCARYPESAEKIRDAKAIGDGSKGPTDSDIVEVIESWHLPYRAPNPEAQDEKEKKGSGDGRHAIAVDGCTLFYEDWDEPIEPFVWLDWRTPLRGFWPTGVAANLADVQYQLNFVNQQIEESLPFAVPKLRMRSGSNLLKAAIDDTIMGVWEYDGDAPPDVFTPSTIEPEIFQHRERLWQMCFDQEGVSQLSATAQKPAGLNSGAALRDYTDIESVRFSQIQQRYEQFHLDIAAAMIRVAVRIAKRDKDFGVTVPERRFTRTIKWSEIKLDHTDYVMQVFPTSSLPSTPAGRKAMVNDLIQMQMISPDEGRRLLDYPDLEASNRLAEAQQDVLDWQIEEIIESGKGMSPEPFQDPVFVVSQAKATYLSLLPMSDVKESSKGLLRNFIAAAVKMIPPPPAPALPPMPGGAAPGMPPVPLLPQNNPAVS